MRVMFVLIGLLMFTNAASAQVAATGRPTVIYKTYSINPDCTASGEIVVRIIEPPEHGRVAVRRARLFPYFREGNSRSVCNRRRVPGVEVVYVSARGYVGPDRVGLDVIFPDGAARRGNIQFTVR